MKLFLNFVLYVLEFLKNVMMSGQSLSNVKLAASPDSNQSQTNSQLSKYFKWTEALYLPQLKVYYTPSEEEKQNIILLAQKLDVIRDHYGKPLTINCWIRPVYQGIDYNAKVGGAKNSAHIVGSAADISDPNGELAAWCKNGIFELTNMGLYCEDFTSTKGWVHFQTRPTKNNPFKP